MKVMRELPQEIQDKLLTKYNKDVKTLELLVKYFANGKPFIVKMTDIDVLGLTLSYAENTQDGLIPKEVRIQFNSPCTVSNVEKSVNVLVKEARDVLFLQPDKSYIPPGRPTDKLLMFQLPTPIEFVLVGVFWIVLYCLMYYDLGLLTRGIELLAGSKAAFQNSVLAILVVNVGLSISVLGVGFFTGFPINELMKWVSVTLFFGFLTARKMIKIAYKYQQIQQKNDVIGTIKKE